MRALLVALLLVVTAPAAGARADVLYVTHRDALDGNQIHRLAEDGTDVRLTADATVKAEPQVSPDGTTVVYVAHPTGPARPDQVWLVAADGTGPRQVTDVPRRHSTPRWSPDGSRIAFVRGGRRLRDEHGELWTMAADGSDQRRVRTSVRTEFGLEWLTDGRIAVRRYADGTDDVWTMRPDGSQLRRLTAGGFATYDFEYAPDLTSVAWAGNFRKDYSGESLLLVFSADGRRMHQVEQLHGRRFGALAWSLDSRRLAYAGGVSAAQPHLSRLWTGLARPGGVIEAVTPPGVDVDHPAWLGGPRQSPAAPPRDRFAPVVRLWGMFPTPEGTAARRRTIDLLALDATGIRSISVAIARHRRPNRRWVTLRTHRTWERLVRGLTPGVYEFRFRAVDVLGNRSRQPSIQIEEIRR